MNGSDFRDWGPEYIQPDQATMLVGRGSSAHIHLGHPAISRHHAELRWLSGKLMVRDMGSRSGTRVNGKRITEQSLNEGDRVEFGPIGYVMKGRRLCRLMTTEGIRLEARGLAVRRGGQSILKGVNLTLQPSHFIGFLGPSGSGKTTLIKCLAGYLLPAEGEVVIDGLDLAANLESYRLRVGYVPQDDIVYSALTGRENLDFALRLRIGDLQSADRAGIVGATLDRLGMTEHADKPAKVLSGGQRKRLNVGMELLARPDILFLDEPTAGLDPAGETRLMHVLKDLAAQGVTVVCATHVMENLALFDQVVVIADQTVLYSDPPQKLLDHFQVSTYPELYEALENRRDSKEMTLAEVPGLHVRTSSLLDRIKLVPIGPPRIKKATQIGVQFMRGLLLIGRDPVFLGLLLSQPVLIGLLINLSQLRPTNMGTLFLFVVLTCIWLGLNNTAREIVRDRRIYVRERLIGVTPEGYLAAKMLLFGIVGLAQTILLIAVIRYANFLLPDDAQELAGWPVAYLCLILWMTYLSAMILGLLISTLANTQEAAVATLPLIILPQLLLTGMATGLDAGRDGSFRSLVVLIANAREASRGVMGWVLEIGSMPTYSRPALALLQPVRADQAPAHPVIIALVDWLHLLLLLLMTATLLVVAFRWRERRWLGE